MAAFSLNEAWNEGVAFVRNNLRAVVIWAAVGALIPALLSIAIIGGMAEQQAMMQQMMAGGDPSAILAALGGGVFLVSLIGQIVTTASYFGAWRMGLSRQAVAAPQAGVYALGAAVLSLLFFIVAAVVVVVVIAIPLGLLGVLGSFGGGQPSAGGVLAAAGIGLLLLLLIFPLVLWLSARLSVYGPAMAAVGSVNPLYGVAQSWRLTKSSQWAILGYLVLLFIAFIVVGMVLALISGVGMLASGGLQSGGQIGTGSLIFSTVISTIVAIPLAVAYIGIPAGIYRALSPESVSDVFT